MSRQADKLRLKLQKMLNRLALTGTNAEAEKLRGDIAAEIWKNKWACVRIMNGKVTVKDDNNE